MEANQQYLVTVDTSAEGMATIGDAMSAFSAEINEVCGLNTYVKDVYYGSSNYVGCSILGFPSGDLQEGDTRYSITSRYESTTALSESGSTYIFVSLYNKNDDSSVQFVEDNLPGMYVTETGYGDSSFENTWLQKNKIYYFSIDTRFVNTHKFYTLNIKQKYNNYDGKYFPPMAFFGKAKNVINDLTVDYVYVPAVSFAPNYKGYFITSDGSKYTEYGSDSSKMTSGVMTVIQDNDVITMIPFLFGKYSIDKMYIIYSLTNSTFKTYCNYKNCSSIKDTWRDGIVKNGKHYLVSLRDMGSSNGSIIVCIEKPSLD